jgi:hypothetical protein
MQPERRLVKRGREYLEGCGAWVFNVHGGDNPFQEVGIPDLLCCWGGLFIGLEFKQPGEHPSPRQQLVMRRIREAGGVAESVSSVDQIEKLLLRISRK